MNKSIGLTNPHKRLENLKSLNLKLHGTKWSVHINVLCLAIG